jgi:hypothetical protein
MRRRDEAADQFMHDERMEAAARLAEDHAAARASAHRRNLEAAKAAAEQCLTEADRGWRRLAITAKTSTPFLPTSHGRSDRRTD